MLIARVLPDIRAIDKVFDYLVPAPMADGIAVGSRVRVRLHNRRVGGWVVELTETPTTDRPLQPLARLSGRGPSAELVELARWAAWRWAGQPSHFLTTASPSHAVAGLPPRGRSAVPAIDGPDGAAVEALAAAALDEPGGKAVLRLPPAADLLGVAIAAMRRGDALVLVPSVAGAAAIVQRLRGAGGDAVLASRDWARAAAGGTTVVGARAAAWAPAPNLAAVVVLDAHDGAYASEAVPTWSALDVAAARAARAGVPCLLVTSCPPVELDPFGPLLTPSRREERAGWAAVDIVDRTGDDPRTGLFSEPLVRLLRSRAEGRVICVLNRKGRARLLACGTCGSLARCERCEAAVEQVHAAAGPEASAALRCRRCGLERPLLCAACGGRRLKILRPGVTRVREELEALAGRAVAEVTGETGEVPEAPIVVGTEAVLHRVAPPVRAVAFLDIDQELLAPRYRAGDEALGLLARAARLVGGRDGGGRVLVQTRLPRHEVLQAALHADPGRVAAVERPRRTELGFPPAAAIALVSGPGAARMVAGMTGVEVQGPDGDRWLVRAPDHRRLCDALAAVPRPAERVRVSVDPLRL